MNIFFMQTKAELLRMFRNKYYIFWSLCMPILFYFLFTRVISTPQENQEVWKAHYLMSMTTFSVMGSSIMSLGIKLVQEQTEGWTRFIKTTPLSTGTYFASKMMAQTAIHLFSILVIFSAGVLINGVELTFLQWITSGIWILFGSLPFLAMGTVIGTMKKVETASGVSNLIYMALAITGGMWMPIEIFPNVMQTIAKWIPSYHFADGAWEIIRGNIPGSSNFLFVIGYLFLFMLLSTYIRRKQEAV
ncbi:ABC transporter permease [Niallia sp. NCCP-28]|uniref:ABC transporter permease n=1 Tax=Niallia sp. NCCP-28 TaxID=2934712 RepID=UPI00208C7BCE|nr:ABC transporter permease [Niallia sp. NCCP-28]GKU83537.1 putative transport permease YvfS [Niallia sp. NCCP-28]